MFFLLFNIIIIITLLYELKSNRYNNYLDFGQEIIDKYIFVPKYSKTRRLIFLRAEQ